MIACHVIIRNIVSVVIISAIAIAILLGGHFILLYGYIAILLVHLLQLLISFDDDDDEDGE